MSAEAIYHPPREIQVALAARGIRGRCWVNRIGTALVLYEVGFERAADGYVATAYLTARRFWLGDGADQSVNDILAQLEAAPVTLMGRLRHALRRHIRRTEGRMR